MVTIAAFYKFTPIETSRLESFREEISRNADRLGIVGLVIIAPEGINGTVAGTPEGMTAFKEYLTSDRGVGALQFKDSVAETPPFKRFKTDLRPEIVTLGNTELVPGAGRHNHLSPAEWHRRCQEKGAVILDTRNKYETEIGIFENAIDPDLTVFSEFPGYVARSGIPKDTPVYMYCTGGIRCEKAILEMERQGYSEVYQLEGGILKYIEEFPDGLFKGECFVFDHRVSVDTKLQPSTKYHLCPHCGNAAAEKHRCNLCSEEAYVCKHCLKIPERNSCSKNCAHHLGRRLNGCSSSQER